MAESVFTKIINGEIPSYKVYEDELTLAFLTIEPVREGHTLVIPKKQIDQYIDLPDEDYFALWASVKIVSARIREVTGKERVGVVIKGLEVPHAHVHLIPFDKGEPLKADHEGDFGEPDHQALAKMAKKLSF